MTKIKAVAFDCDGVMFDTAQVNRSYYNHLLEHFGRPPMDEAQFAFVHMHTVHAAIVHLFEDPRLIERVQAYRRRLDYLPFLDHMAMEPHLEDLLRWLKPRVRTAVVTNRTNTIGPVLKKFGLDAWFDLVISADDVRHPKPHPEPLLKVLSHFGIQNREMLYIGDSGVDEAAARAAGVPLAAYCNPTLAAACHVSDLSKIRAYLETRSSPGAGGIRHRHTGA